MDKIFNFHMEDVEIRIISLESEIEKFDESLKAKLRMIKERTM